jgi:hypothetical protein
MKEFEQTNLLVEGLTSYPKALAALNEFVRLVTSAIQDVVEQELENLSQALQIELRREELGEYVRPNRLAIPNPKHTTLGARIERITESGWGLYFFLWWSKGTVTSCVSIWLRDANIAETIYAEFHKTVGKCAIQIDAGRELYLARQLQPDKPDEFSMVMQELTQDFSNLWKQIGGFEKFISNR